MMAMAMAAAEGEPMMEINTTPLIDVMLVLLIMIIMTIPIQTHAVKLDLPQDQQNRTPPPIDPVKNKVVITPQGQVLWNGTPVDLVTLRQYLDLTTTMNPVPGAASAAGPAGALRAGRRGPRRHQARPGHRDGLRRQRGLRQLLGTQVPLGDRGGPAGPPFSFAAEKPRIGR